MMGLFKLLLLVFIRMPLMGIITILVLLVVVVQSLMKGLRMVINFLYGELNKWVFPMGPEDGKRPWWNHLYYWPFNVIDFILAAIDYMLQSLRLILIVASKKIVRPSKKI